MELVKKKKKTKTNILHIFLDLIFDLNKDTNDVVNNFTRTLLETAPQLCIILRTKL